MDKVIIVEDDRIIRRSLSRAPWKEHGFLLAG
jgi:YesN/AraC family two-component response regulator